MFSKRHQPPRGVIYVRTQGMDLARINAAVLAAMRHEVVDGQHVTIDRNQTRRRPLPYSSEKNG